MVNNTVIDLNDKRPGPPWVRVGKHKNGTAPADCVVRNNLTTALHVDSGAGMVIDHNLIIDDPARFFVDASQHDLRLRKGSPAIDAGRRDLAPDTDVTGMSRPQGRAVDIGAYEHPVQ